MEISTCKIISSPQLEAEMDGKWSYLRSLTVAVFPSSPIFEGVIGKRIRRGSGRVEHGKTR